MKICLARCFVRAFSSCKVFRCDREVSAAFNILRQAPVQHRASSRVPWQTKALATPNAKLMERHEIRVAEQKCRTSLQNMDLPELLDAANFWITLSMETKYSAQNLVREIFHMCVEKEELSTQQVTQLMLSAAFVRSIDQRSLRNIERRILECIDEFSSEELSVLAFGFFRNRYTFTSDKMLTVFVEVICRDGLNMPEVCLSFLLKALRAGEELKLDAQRKFAYWFLRIADALSPRVATGSRFLATNLAVLCQRKEVYCGKLFHEMEKFLLQNLQDVRLKDITKTLVTFGNLNYVVSLNDFHAEIFAELKKESRQEEIELHPQSFLSLVVSLAYLDLYPTFFLDIVLTEKFWRNLYYRIEELHRRDYHRLISDKTNEMCLLHNSVQIECPSYVIKEKQWLNETFPIDKNFVSIDLSDMEKFEYRTHRQKLLSTVAMQLQGYHGRIQPVVSHFSLVPDIIFDKETKERQKNETRDRIVVVPLQDGSYAYHSKIMRGNVAMKLRQLERLGYQVITVDKHFLKLHKCEKQRLLAHRIYGRNFESLKPNHILPHASANVHNLRTRMHQL